MVNPSSLYANPVRGVCEVSALVFNIFFDNFKTFAVLAGCQILVQIPVVLVFFVAFFAIFAVEFASFQAMINHGTRRFLYQNSDPYDSYGSSDSEDSPRPYTPPTGEDPFSQPSNQAFDPSFSNTDPTISTMETAEILSLVLTMLAFYILFIAALMCIGAAFQGAFVRAAAEVFAGRAPCMKSCLKFGRQKICDIICYGFLYILIVATAAIVWITLAAVAFQNYIGLFIVAVLVFVGLFIYFSCSMMGSMSAIVVENKGAMASMKRSWQVCSPSICFIFCSTFIFFLLEFAGKLVIRVGLRLFLVGTDAATTAAILAISSLVVSLLIGPLNAM